MIKLFFIFITLLFSTYISMYSNIISDSKIEMVYIESGEFLMGSNLDVKVQVDKDEMPAFKARISDFYLSKYEISYGQWKYVYDWAISNGYEFDNDGRAGASYYTIAIQGQEYDKGTLNKDHPVVGINWYDVIKWSNAKSEMDGLIPIYYTDSMKKNVYRKDTINIMVTMVLWHGNGYRLPTEAEWEYSARAGSDSIFPWGNGYKDMYKYANSLDIAANNLVNARMHINVNDKYADTASVYSFMPNDFHLHNMIGNVWEWVFDFYGPYENIRKKNPKGRPRGYRRVIRGGSFYTSFIEGLKSSNRYGEDPYLADSFIGFRIAKNR